MSVEICRLPPRRAYVKRDSDCQAANLTARQYNVLGAIDFFTKRMLTVTNDSYITATQACEMLRLIAKEYEGKIVHIVLDNARHQKCRDVCKLAGELGLDLVCLPPCSPNLNLIERLWKFVKGELRSRYYDSFPAFRERIDAIISSLSDQNKAAVWKKRSNFRRAGIVVPKYLYYRVMIGKLYRS